MIQEDVRRKVNLYLILIFTPSGYLLAKSQASDLPNILLIVADDMGYSDFTPFGGEIGTPNLDKLAKRGISLSNFYSSPL